MDENRENSHAFPAVLGCDVGMQPGMHPRVDIEGVLRVLARVIDHRWARLVERHHVRLQRTFEVSPRASHTLYMRALMRPLAAHVAARRLLAYPRLPGHVVLSRDWYAPGESHEEQWWCASICSDCDEAFGTLVTHAHFAKSRFRLQRRPSLFVLPFVRRQDARSAIERCLDGSDPWPDSL